MEQTHGGSAAWLITVAGCTRGDLDNWRKRGFLSFLPAQGPGGRYTVADAVTLSLFVELRNKLGLDREKLNKLVELAHPLIQQWCHQRDVSDPNSAFDDNRKLPRALQRHMIYAIIEELGGLSLYAGELNNMRDVYANRFENRSFAGFPAGLVAFDVTTAFLRASTALRAPEYGAVLLGAPRE